MIWTLIDLKRWIRIRIETNEDPPHCLLGSLCQPLQKITLGRVGYRVQK